MKITISKNWIGVLLFIIIAFTVPYQLFTKNCVLWNCPPKRDFTIFDLDIPSHFYPKGSEIIALVPDRSPAIEQALGGARWKGGTALYLPKKFGTNNLASKWFNNQIKLDLLKQNPDLSEEISVKNILNFQSGFADESLTKCGYIQNDFSCAYFSRYQEYYIYFNASIDEEKMSAENFINVLEYIDSMMMNLLEIQN